MRLTKYHIAPLAFGAMVVVLGVTLLVIGARSPYTHSNRAVGPDSSYTRTRQILVGAPEPRDRSDIAIDPHGDLVTQGGTLYFGLDCASCHGLTGRGGVFAPSIAGTDAAVLAKKTSAGPGGMPQFTGLSDQDLEALAAYLKPGQ